MSSTRSSSNRSVQWSSERRPSNAHHEDIYKHVCPEVGDQALHGGKPTATPSRAITLQREVEVQAICVREDLVTSSGPGDRDARATIAKSVSRNTERMRPTISPTVSSKRQS